MTSSEPEGDPTRPDVGWGDPTPADQQHPDSAFPGAGARVDDAERQAALEAMPGGTATVGDMVDSDALDSRAHETGAGAEELDEQVHGHSVD